MIRPALVLGEYRGEDGVDGHEIAPTHFGRLSKRMNIWRHDVRIPRVPPLLIAGSAAALQTVASRGSRSSPTSRTCGALIALASATMLGASVVRFRRADTTVNPVGVDDASSLVQAGPYRLSRNPMYVGMAGLLFAHAVRRRSWLALVPLFGYVVVMDRTQIPAEENALREKFGADYDDYASHVPRWLNPCARVARS